MFGSLGAPELLIILAIIVVLFGAARISGIGKEIGKGIKEFRRELKDEDGDKKKDDSTVASTSSDEKTSGTQAH